MKSNRQIPIEQINTSSLVTIDNFNDFTSSYNTGSFVGDFNGTASYAQNSLTASYVNITKEQIGLGNVDNTSDLDKPISTLVSSSLNNKLDKVTTNDGIEKIYIKNGDGTQGVKSINDLSNLETILQSMWNFSKFHSSGTNNYPFTGAPINGGNLTAWYNGSTTSRYSHNIFTNGFLTMGTGGNGTNRGYRFIETLQSQASLYEGFTFLGLISPYTIDDVTTRIGWIHTNTFTANSLNLSYTCHFEILNDKLKFVTAINDIATYGPEIIITPYEWLFLFIEVEKNNDLEKRVRFKVKNINGTLLYNEISETNIPTNNIISPSSTMQANIGFITTKNSSTISEYLANISYMGYGNQKPNFLKDF